MVKVDRNRFTKGTAEISGDETAGHTAQAEAKATLETLRFSHGQAMSLLGAGARVSARRITTEEFIEKVRAAKDKIINAQRFDVAFQEEILNDPILSTAFGGYLELVRSGQVSVSNEKRQDTEVVFNRQQVVHFLETFQAKLEDLKQKRESTPVNLTQLGLQLIQRNGDIQETVADPLASAGTVRQMAEIQSLGAEQRKAFYILLAKGAVQSVAVEANRTPENRAAALGNLEVALRGLVALGESGETFREYFAEAQRLAREIDGPTGAARRVQVEAIRLWSSKPAEQKAAAGRIEAVMSELMKARLEKQIAGHNLDQPQIDAYHQILNAVRPGPNSPRTGDAQGPNESVRALFAKMPDFIESITGAAQATEGKAADYKPSAAEAQAKLQMTQNYVSAISAVFPKLGTKEESDEHLAACEHAQSLILANVGLDNSVNIATLIGELTRHAGLAEKALQLLGTDFIPQPASRLNAASSAIISLLQNGQIDAAYKLFHDPVFETKDAASLSRQGAVFAKATRVAIETKLEVQASDVAKEWLATGYLRVVEASMGNPHNLGAIKEMLRALTEHPTFKLDGQQAADLVGKIQAEFQKFGTQTLDFVPGMVALLAQRPDSEAAMAKAKQLIETALTEMQNGRNFINTPFNGQQYQYNITGATIALLEVVSKNEQLSGFIKPVVEKIIATQMPDVMYPLASSIPRLGQFADKDEIARMLKPNPQQIPYVALSLAGDVATTQFARELIAQWSEGHMTKEIKDLTPEERSGFLMIEAAARLAVPNLITGKALVGLVKAFQAREVPPDALHLARSQLPRAIIDEVLSQIDSVEIRDFLQGRAARKARDQSESPDQTERLPVAIVAGGASAPKED